MTHPIYREFAEAHALVKAKAHDYAEDDNVFSNFEFAAQVAGVKTEQVFAVLLGVKVARLGQLIGNNKKPNFESIDDTLLDTMNYAGLLKAYMRADANNMTVRDAFEATEAEEDVGWYVKDAMDAAENDLGPSEGYITHESEGYNPGESLDDGPQPSRIGVGSIIKLKSSKGGQGIERGPRVASDAITYEVVEMNDTLASVGARPTKNWHDTLGAGIRTFALERVEVA